MDRNRKWRTFFYFITEQAFEMKSALCLCCRSDSSEEIVPVILLSAAPMPELYIIYVSKMSMNFTFAPIISPVHTRFPFKAANRAIYRSPACRSRWGLLLAPSRQSELCWSCQGMLKIHGGSSHPPSITGWLWQPASPFISQQPTRSSANLVFPHSHSRQELPVVRSLHQHTITVYSQRLRRQQHVRARAKPIKPSNL